jgi:radical SAM protein with 4Fe4S-binding SPASM domain
MTTPADSAIAPLPPKVIAAVVCDFDRAAIGTRSRLCDPIANKPLLAHVLDRLLAVEGLAEIALLVPPSQHEIAQPFLTDPRLHLLELIPRPAAIDRRIRIGRAWNLHAWRGGAGQFTCFDEEYHPAAIGHACTHFKAEHVLTLHSHSLFLDIEMTAALLQHHLHKNNEMRVTYTPAAPGLSGMVLRANILHEMADHHVMPWQLLAYDPATPNPDTLIREACMQVDPALSKIPNRFCADTDRSFAFARDICEGTDKVTRRQGDKVNESPLTLSPCHPVTLSSIDLAQAAARTIATGVRDFTRIPTHPRELEIELTPHRLTAPPGSVPADIRAARTPLDAAHWERFFAAQNFPDDLLLTFAGDGDAALYPDLCRVLRAARKARPLSICVQTDLAADNLDTLLAAIAENLIDVLTIPMFGHTRDTYNAVSRTTLHDTVMANFKTLAAATSAAGGIPLVIPRLLKVRATIPELEPFFDTWVHQAGWAVLESPTDRAGAIPFEAVVDMGPSKRRPCRRLWDRLLLRADGTAAACDQDLHDHLKLGDIHAHTLPQLWNGTHFTTLRQQHADGHTATLTPCTTCREWHRP